MVAMDSDNGDRSGMNRRTSLIYAALLGAWLVICLWQRAEHGRFAERLRGGMADRAQVMSSSMDIMLRAMRQFGGFIPDARLQVYLDELVDSRELLGVALVNQSLSVIVESGETEGLDPEALDDVREVWKDDRACFMHPVDLGISTFGEEERPREAFILPPPEERPLEEWQRQGKESVDNRKERLTRALDYIKQQLDSLSTTNAALTNSAMTGLPGRRRFRRGPPMSEERRAELREKYGVHAAIFQISTGRIARAIEQDGWLRTIIVGFGFLAMAAGALALKNVTRSNEIQMRLLRTRAQNQHLVEMNMAAAGLAHETRNPLNLIRGMAQMINRDDSASTAVRERCGEMIAEVDRVTGQLNEFINFSKPPELRRAGVPLAGLVEDVLRPLSAELEDAGIKVDCRCDQLGVDADEKMLRQVIFNIVLNSVQAMKGGGRLEISARPIGETVELELRDTGPGIASEYREKIFQPYFTTREKEGSGLGLAIVRQITLAHGWEIAFAPNEPSGATFRISRMKAARA